jgi:hypothetical protein
VNLSTFDSIKRLLKDVLADTSKRRIQLLDFQRGWIWDDKHVSSLVISIAPTRKTTLNISDTAKIAMGL